MCSSDLKRPSLSTGEESGTEGHLVSLRAEAERIRQEKAELEGRLLEVDNEVRSSNEKKLQAAQDEDYALAA